jgi:hypothetical protein
MMMLRTGWRKDNLTTSKMDFLVHIDKKRNIRSLKVSGLLNITELVNKLGDFYKSSEYDPYMNALWDLRTADFSKVTTDAVHSFVDIVKKYWGQEGKNKKAALVVSSDFDYGIARMYEIPLSLGTSGDIMVFKDYDEAEKWLGEA